MRINAGTVAAFSVSVIWGLSFVAAQMVLVTLSPILLATVRFIIATLLFTPIILLEAQKGSEMTRSDLLELAGLGFLSISIYFWLQYTGVKYAGAGISALVVVGLIPVVTGIISSIILKETFTEKKAVGTLLGFSGVALITLPKLILGKTNAGFYLGIGALLGNTLCWSLYSTLSRRLIQRIGRPLVITAFATLFGTLTLLPMSLTSEWSLILELTLRQWGCIGYLASICSVAGFFLWNYALSRLEAVRAAVWLYIEPVAAFMSEAFIFGAVPSTTILTGGICIIAGALLTSLSKE